MPDAMTFPKTLDEFMEQYKIVDTEQVYTNGTELVPIFRIKQWEDAHKNVVERKKGKWMAQKGGGYRCSECKHYALDERDGNLVHVSAKTKFCPYCGAEMEKNDENLHRNSR